MQVINFLEEESFAHTNEKENLALRRDEIGDLMEIAAYCQNESVKEPLEYHETLWEAEVQKEVSFADWLYGNRGLGSEEDRRRLQEAFSKRIFQPMEGGPVGETANRKVIRTALGEFQNCVCKVEDYIKKRRDILGSVRNVTEYQEFMQSCFVNSCFADDILSEMKHITHFPDRTKELTKALGILNDEAVELYQQYCDRLEEAMKILTAHLQRECAPDPEHAEELLFTFTYWEQLEGKSVPKTKEVECSPHLKLLHAGSNLRIYFYWCDAVIGAGEKVLVGRIGRHPY